jgi:hypothetical protein
MVDYKKHVDLNSKGDLSPEHETSLSTPDDRNRIGEKNAGLSLESIIQRLTKKYMKENKGSINVARKYTKFILLLLIF